jgi:hypothetical protein
VPTLTVKACVDRMLPDELLLESMRHSLAENPNNAPAINRRMLPPGVMPDVPHIFLAAITGKLWKPGRTLRVRFLDGDPEIHARIPPFAHVWSEVANLKFAFVDDPDAEIRISFESQGSWSYIGTDALVIPASQPTMNFGWLTRATPADEYSRVVTHEFGHVLGCIHEHQNPANDIPWDKEVVYSYYQGPPNYWTRDQVDVNVFTRYSADITQFSKFDPTSIMLYPIPNEFTIGDFEVGWNKVLSETDRRFAVALYPFAERPQGEIAVDAQAVDAAIGEFGEVDTYTFSVSEAGEYRVETEGESDVVISLFGPDDDTQFVGMDDDSGRRHNARLVAALRPGRYTVRVRHFSPKRTGGYRIGIFSHTPT